MTINPRTETMSEQLLSESLTSQHFEARSHRFSQTLLPPATLLLPLILFAFALLFFFLCPLCFGKITKWLDMPLRSTFSFYIAQKWTSTHILFTFRILLINSQLPYDEISSIIVRHVETLLLESSLGQCLVGTHWSVIIWYLIQISCLLYINEVCGQNFLPLRFQKFVLVSESVSTIKYYFSTP